MKEKDNLALFRLINVRKQDALAKKKPHTVSVNKNSKTVVVISLLEI